jgi:hypothetical protein
VLSFSRTFSHELHQAIRIQAVETAFTKAAFYAELASIHQRHPTSAELLSDCRTGALVAAEASGARHCEVALVR